MRQQMVEQLKNKLVRKTISCSLPDADGNERRASGPFDEIKMSPSALKLRMRTAMNFGIVKSLSGMVKDTQEGMKSVSVTAGSMVQKSKENMKKTFTFIQPENTNTVQSEHTNTQPSQQNENESNNDGEGEVGEDNTERDHRRV